MARLLILLPQEGFDPTEVALPWAVWRRAGHEVRFASETGAPAVCDAVTLTGEGLPLLARSLRARDEARRHHAALLNDTAFAGPLRQDAVRVEHFAAVHFPGGHAPGMRSWIESRETARIARDAFARAMPVSAICHGVLPLARAGVLAGRRTTSLTAMMERLSIGLTRHALGDHYRTYREPVEAEARRAVGPDGAYLAGPLFPRYAGEAAPEAGFVVRDGNYLSARWPGDAWTLALRLLDLV